MSNCMALRAADSARTKPRAAARTEPHPTIGRSLALSRDFQRIPKKILVPKSKNPLPSAKVILASQIVWATTGMGVRFLLPNRSKPIFSAFLNCLGCSLKKTVLTQKTAAKLVSVVVSDSLLAQIQNCFVMSHG
jgi:hypothetical protein